MSVPPNKKRSKSDANTVLQYSGMAFQMAIILGIAVYIGKQLDVHFGTEKPYLTALSVIIAFPLSLYLSLKGLFKKKA